MMLRVDSAALSDSLILLRVFRLGDVAGRWVPSAEVDPYLYDGYDNDDSREDEYEKGIPL